MICASKETLGNKGEITIDQVKLKQISINSWKISTFSTMDYT